MGAAAYSRGTRKIVREADESMPVAIARSSRDAERDQVAALHAHVATLTRDLMRARRCIAELRRARDERTAEQRAEVSSSQAAIRILARLAFPAETSK